MEGDGGLNKAKSDYKSIWMLSFSVIIKYMILKFILSGGHVLWRIPILGIILLFEMFALSGI